MAEKYTVSQYSVESVLGFIKSGEIAIPEIQRPFVWKARQVRDLIDSLYTGYPTGYLIISQNPDMKLKDGSLSVGKKIMIDGQQRTTALMTAIVGLEVLNEDYEKKRIKIAFNPLVSADSEEERFQVLDNAIMKDKVWIDDIATIFKDDFDPFTFVSEYVQLNADKDLKANEINKAIMELLKIKQRQIGVITLDKDLSIDEVTEIFIRINSQGAKLNQSDFVMSKIASNECYGGNMLRKAIDYFSHLALQPSWFSEMSKDTDYAKSDFYKKMEWLKDDEEDILDVSYSDILRIAFMYKFARGKMKDLASLLSGRDFEARDYKESIAEQSFKTLTEGVCDFMKEYNYKNFILAIKSAGFKSKKLIGSTMTIDFAYTLYLLLSSTKEISSKEIDKYVKKWFVLSVLTSRYTGSSETRMDADLRAIREKGFVRFFSEVEQAELSDVFWNVGLVQKLESSIITSPFFSVFIASQINNSDDSLFEKGSKIGDLVTVLGDIHHIFPKAYLIKNGIKDKTKYNQIANFIYFDTQVNKDVSDDAPCDYFTKAINACANGKSAYGNIKNSEDLTANMKGNCIPSGIETMTYVDYPTFLEERRKLMAEKIHKYYDAL